MSDSSVLYIFPGQGSQYAGIGSDLVKVSQAARDVYQEASDTLGYDMQKLSFEDPDSKINLTRYTQPVLLTHSIACLRAMQESQQAAAPQASVMAGHSLGEYSALVAAGALSFADGVKLVSIRGSLMGEHGEGEMEALPVEQEVAQSYANRFYCAVAACNLADQTVVGGRSEDLDFLTRAFSEDNPRKRSARLKTEGAFHTYYMVTAAMEFRQHLENTLFSSPQCQVMSNFTGSKHDDDPKAIRTRLFFQLIHPVLWNQNLLNAVDTGVNKVIEFGGGIGKGETPEEKRPNLEGIVKKTFRRSENPPSYQAIINEPTLQALST
ncbi:MAG: [acyl-carrier-protein] S-malonyltransferase [Parasphingorhabdus sp.]|jgi:[acyl-carrier-protein] S-malonyltransferase